MDDKNFNRRKFLGQLGLVLGVGSISPSFVIPVSEKNNDECKETPILELGPYAVMKYRKQADHDIDLTQIEGNSGIAFGEIIIVFGKITDKNCNPVPSALIEIWSANHYGKYHHEYDKSERLDDPNFQGWGQAISNNVGEYKFKTILPGPYGARTRHIHFKVSRRNYHELTTQLFFDGEEKNKRDFILNSFTHEEQQLITKPILNIENSKQVEFNIVLDEIKNDSLPEKVLKDYTGHYVLKNAPFDMQTYVMQSMNIQVNDFSLMITRKKNQLYMKLSFFPTIELGWYSKDEFQSWSFSNTFLKFTRNTKGKVIGLKLYFGENEYVDAIKNNR